MSDTRDLLAQRFDRAIGDGSVVISIAAVLPLVAPELGEWAAYWAASAPTGTTAEAGVSVVTSEDADRIYAAATRWIAVVEEAIGQ